LEETDPKIVQVAMSCRDMQRSRCWYAKLFGYVPSGGLDPATLADPPDIPSVQGVPGASLQMLWAVDQQDFFQLELFQYRAPEARPMPTGWRACDIGYTTIGLHVTDFDGTLARLAEEDVPLLTAPLEIGGARRVCVRDPDGVLLEIMEDDPRVAGSGPRARPAVPVATRMVRASVPNLDQSLAYFIDTLGMHPEEPTLHRPDHERLWGLPGATPRVQLLSCGDFWIELAQYETPPPAAWPEGYRISDLGIVNFAIGTRDGAAYRTIREALQAASYDVTPELTSIGGCFYAMSDQGFSVEVLFLPEDGNEFAGFVPEPAHLT
jgi:catechol 2,3-dioxygenase-like lactoylglutathione lyase family enzyme